MANINKKWKRIICTGCSHGDLADRGIQKQVLAFKKRWRPEITLELGDVVDTAALRTGARGTPDEAHDVDPDFSMAERWIQQYEPTHVAFGNHDWRLQELMHSQNAVVSHCATVLWERLQKQVRALKAKTRPYDFEKNWFEIGGVAFGHGFWYGEHAVRDHAEYLGMPVVMAHLHAPQQVQGRTRNWSQSFCVGTLADVEKLTYARRRRATARWGHGIVWGEVSDKGAKLWLSQCEPGGTLPFPI